MERKINEVTPVHRVSPFCRSTKKIEFDVLGFLPAPLTLIAKPFFFFFFFYKGTVAIVHVIDCHCDVSKLGMSRLAVYHG